MFRENSALISGGVLYVRKGNTNVWNSSFVDNRAGTKGGVIDAEYASMISISQTTVFGNKVKGDKGGVLAARRKTEVHVQNTDIQNNSARSCGAMLVDVASILELRDSRIDGNYAHVLGGAFCFFNNSLSVIMNSTFVDNRG